MELGLDIFCVEYILSWPCGQNHYYYYYYYYEEGVKQFGVIEMGVRTERVNKTADRRTIRIERA